MPLPANRVDTVRVPNDTTTYDIVPSSLQDGSGKHSIATPTTTKDTTLVVGVKINNVTKEPTNGIVDLGTFQDGLDGDQLAAVNSGITADKVTKYEGYETKINSNTSEIGIIKDTLKSGVTFKGKITDPTLPAATDYNNGDLIIFGEKEYICFDNGISKEWIELGDEGTHLTKAMADTYYVPYSDADHDVNLGEHSATVKNIVANGTTKLGGGFEPIKSYKVQGVFDNNTISATLDIFVEKRSMAYDTVAMYSFYGSLNTSTPGNELIGYGTYFLDTGNNTISSLEFISGLNVYTFEDGEFRPDALTQSVNVDESIADYVNTTLSGMISKDSMGKVVVGKDFTVEPDGSASVSRNLNVGNNLKVTGTTKLAGGIEPIKTYTFKTTSPIATVNYTLSIYAEGPWNPISNFRPFFGTLDKRSGNRQEDSYIIGAYSVDTDTGTALTYVHGNLFDGLTSTDPKNHDYTHIYCSVASGGTATVTTEEYALVSDVNKKQDRAVDLTGITAKTVEGALTEIKGDIPNNIKDGTGANSIQENQDGTGGKFDFSGKNPNAFSFDATLNGQLDYGALGAFSSSFGGKGQARGKRSFQVGTTTIAYGNYTFASGSDSVAMGPASHVEGYSNTTGPTADSSHAEGGENLVTSNRGHVEGYKNTVKGMNGHGEGENVLVTENAEAGHAEGTNTKANNISAHAEGQQTEANGKNSHSENTLTKANGDSSHAEGYGNEVNSYAGHIEGSGNKILNTLPSSGGGDTPGPSPTDPDDPTFNINEHLGYNSHVEGSLNISYGYNSHTEGTKNTTFGHYAHTEGSGNKNYGTNNHMEGSQNKMSDTAAIAITDSHIEGTNNNVTNPCSNLHMGGVSNTGGADGAYVMGHNNTVSSTARYSATFGKGLKATDEDTIVLGTYNKVQQGTGRMVVIGNGTSDTARKNAVEIMRDGRVKLFKAPEEDNDAVRLSELHSKQDVIYGTQADALNSTITKAKVDKYEGYETKINSNTTAIGDLVPYTGATKEVDLGNHAILMDTLNIDPATITFRMSNDPQNPQDLYIQHNSITVINGDSGDTIFWPYAAGSTTPGAKVFALTSDITSHAGIDKVGTVTGITMNGTSKAPDTNGTVDVGNVCTYTNTQVDTKIDAASQKMVSIIYDDLVTARNNKDLVPGMNYRITDYTAVISPGSVTEKSAGHQFDLIVTADGPDTLNENARAILHEGDTYFKDCDLNSWRLKYCLDNDRSRFYWAYEKGKGVIYWMEDEFHNQVPYDFKNIMFKRYKVNTVGKNTPVSFDSFFNGIGNLSLTDCISPVKTSAIGDVASNTSIWCYTFCTFENNDPTIPLDASLNLFPDGIVVETPRLLSFLHAFDNVIEPLIVCSPSIETTKKNYQRLNNIVFMKYDKDTSVDTKDDFRVYGNRFSSSSQNITLGRKCYYNTFNGNNLGLMVGYGCAENTFTTCGNTAIAYNCSGNIFNSRFGYNLVFNNCKNNSFGIKCQYLELGENSSFNTFEDDISYVRLVADATGTEPLQYVTVSKGVKGTGSGAGMLHLSQPRGLTHTITYRRVQSETIDV